MKTFAGCLILVAIALSQPIGVFSQELTPEDRQKLELAEKSADRFVERFRQTLDFGTVWPEFHMSDISCTVKTTGYFNLNDYKRLKIDNELLERFYVAVMNYFYLKGVHDLTVSPSDFNLSDDAIEPKEIRLTERNQYTLRQMVKSRRRPERLKK